MKKLKEIFGKKLNKKQTAAIITVSAVTVISAICVAVYFTGKNSVPVAGTTLLTDIQTQSQIQTQTTDYQTQTQTETTQMPTTEKATKPPAEPETKKFIPKPQKPIVKPQAPSEKGKKLNVPMVSQLPDYPTGCEAASATMLLKYYGYNVSLQEMVNAIPREDLYSENGRVYGPSIYEKFVGDPTQTYTSERPGYGAFSPVITKSINSVLRSKNGKHSAKNITGCSLSALFKNIDSGNPVIVWATSKMRTPQYVNSWYIKNPGGEDIYFEYPRGTHVTVLCGYDSEYVYIADPYYGYAKYTVSQFADKWNLLGNQAIVLSGYVPETTSNLPTTVTTTVTQTQTQPTTEVTQIFTTDITVPQTTTEPEATGQSE